MNTTRELIRVTDDESENGFELSTENDMSLKAETLSLQYPECFALAYKRGNKWKVVERKNQQFLPPQDGWGTRKYICVKGKKIKFKITNLLDGLTRKKIQEYFESYGIVEVQKFDKSKRIAFIIIKFITDQHLKNLKTEQHPFTIEEVLRSDREKFSKRSGTTNVGHKFEELTMASLLLNLTLDDNVQDFRMSSNDEEFGSFDDIVIDIESTNGEIRKYAMQLKYKNDPQQSLKNCLTSVNGDFSIQKYFNDFTDMIEHTRSYNLILFTNLKFTTEPDESLKLDNTNIGLQIVKESLPKEFGDGFCYKFQNSQISNQRKMFFDKFLLYPNQPNVEKMEHIISEKFDTAFSFKNIVNYLKFISEWSNKASKNKNKLNKTFIKELIALQMLGGSIKSFPTVEKSYNENVHFLKQAILDFTVTIVDTNYFENIKKIWETETGNLNEIESVINKFLLKYLNDDEKRVAALWILNRCPLIITESETSNKVISLCREKSFVLLKESDTSFPTQNLKVFTKLTDLDRNSTICKNLTKSVYCSIQGREAINLEDLINQCRGFENIVTTTELIQMLDGPLIIGKQETVLDIYIDRLVTRLTISYNFFDNVDKDTLLIISCQGKESGLKKHLKSFNLINIEDYLNQEQEVEMETFRRDDQTKNLGNINEHTAYFSKNQCTKKTFNIICEKISTKKKCHHFRIVEDGCLEWMYSKGEISDLQKYKTHSSFLKETDLFNTEETINIISADPGMGKTELMKKFNNMYSSSFWTILIEAKDWSEYLKREDCNKENFFATIFKNICKTKFEENVLKVLKSTKRITFFWDGLDELSITQIDTVISLIDDLVREGFKQWISCRRHLENKLEKKFNVLSRSIKQFDKDEQRNYIYRRLGKKDISSLEDVVQKIHDYVDRVQHNELLGIPLQIFMLTELLLNDPKFILLNKIFPVTDLYEFFINIKIEGFVKERAKLNETNRLSEYIMITFYKKILKYHQKVALFMVLEDQFIRELNIQLNSTTSLQETIYGIGIITGKTDDGQLKFLHYSYAEYFVALYFYERRNKFSVLIREQMFQENYQNVRFMFDLLLAKNCPAHLAVLYNNFDYLKSCKDYSCKDEGGRNPLQIACAWGPRFPLLKTVQRGHDVFIDDSQAKSMDLSTRQHYDEMLNLLLKHNSILDKDLFFRFNSIEYADISLSLKPLEIFLKNNSHLSFHTLKNFNDVSTVLYYSAKFNFSSILHDLQHIPVLQIIQNCNTILHLASERNSVDCVEVLLRHRKYRLKINAKNRFGETSIYRAAQNGHYEIVKYLTESGADINIQTHGGAVPIHIAASNGHIEVVRLLVNELKANMNAKTKKSFTSINAAALTGHYDIVKYLADSGANVNIQDQGGNVPIHSASFNGHLDVVKLLVDLKANMNAENKKGSTPIYLAAQKGHYEVVKYLAESGADVNIQNRDGWVPIHSASLNGHIEVVRLLLNKPKANMNAKTKKSLTPIYAAALTGHYDIVKYLAALGADANIQARGGCIPVHAAAQSGHIEVVKLLVSLYNGVNARTEKGATPISFAAYNGHYEVVKYLTESGADVNIQEQDGRSPIHYAVQKGHIEVVKLLVSLKTNVNAKTEKGSTPISFAAEKGHYEVVKYLAECGAAVNIQDQNGCVSIHYAAQNGHIEIVKLLVSLKTNVNAKSKKGSTPIFLAAQKGHYQVVKYLAESGADVNIQNQDGNLPIHAAAQNGHVEVVKLLVNDLKANLHAKNNKGFTPVDLASKNGRYQVLQYLGKSKCSNCVIV